MRIKKSFRKMLAMAIAAGTFAAMPLASAEVKEYEGFGEYVMSDFETPDTAKQRAKERAEQNAMEQAGVYLESYTEVVNARITKDEIKTITNGILKVKDVKYVMSPISESGGSFQITATLKATIDTNGIDDWLKRSEEEKSDLVAQNQELMKTNAEQERQITDLKRKLATTADEQDRKKLSIEFENADQSFLAKQKVAEGLRKFYDNDYLGAANLYLDAIKMDSNYADAYYKLGNAEVMMGLYDVACREYDTAIRLDPNNADMYSTRGTIYLYVMNDCYRAIDDFTTAITISPQKGSYYCSRGYAYKVLGMFGQAVSDYTMAINLQKNNPEVAMTYLRRAMLYSDNKQFRNAISDYTSAIKMCTSDMMSAIGAQLYCSRGVAYGQIGNYILAIDDFTKSIQFDRTKANAYYGRALCYASIGNYQQANADRAKAEALGYTE